MRLAREIMHSPAPTVPPGMTAKELHHFLDEHGIEGACLVEDGELTGVVTEMDLVFREKKVHLPTFFFFLDAVIPLSDPRKTYDEVLKIAGTRVEDLASRNVVTVGPDATVEEMASLMVDRHLTVLPVVDGAKLIGMVTKHDVVKATLG